MTSYWWIIAILALVGYIWCLKIEASMEDTDDKFCRTCVWYKDCKKKPELGCKNYRYEKKEGR